MLEQIILILTSYLEELENRIVSRIIAELQKQDDWKTLDDLIAGEVIRQGLGEFE